MLKIGKYQQSSNLRLPETFSIPNTEDLQFILSKAQRNWRCSVEQPIKTPDGNTSFVIMVKCEIGTGSPCWTLYRDDQPGSPVCWTHISTDMLLIHNLIGLEYAAAASRKTVIGAQPVATPAQQLEASMSEAQQASSTQASPTQPSSSEASSTQASSIEASSTKDAYSEKPQARIEVEAQPEFDAVAIQSVQLSLCRADTGILTFPAFLYFLQLECVRFQRGGLPFSVIVFDLGTKGAGLFDSMPLPAVREMGNRIHKMKRTLDMLAHYESYEYAFMLPHTDPAGGAIFTSRVEKLLLDNPLMPGIEASSIALHFGIAGFPQDGQTAGQLLAAASKARRWAKENSASICVYSDLK